jgi:arsenate reductase-like glutaredoxin family protein
MQIFGTKKCAGTRKAERFFRDRKIPYHLVDLNERKPSRGELESIRRGAGGKSLVDPECAAYKKRGMAYMEFDEIEELLEDPLLLLTPVVREGNRIVIGIDEAGWKELTEGAKK